MEYEITHTTKNYQEYKDIMEIIKHYELNKCGEGEDER